MSTTSRPRLMISPRINPDLLQRSEVVALFNTLHRVSESLAAVEQFRKMYRDTQAAATSAERPAATEKRKSKGKSKSVKEKTSKQGAKKDAAIETSTWTGAAATALYAAYELFRQGCRGCMDVCWRVLVLLDPPLRGIVERTQAGRSGSDL